MNNIQPVNGISLLFYTFSTAGDKKVENSRKIPPKRDLGE
jgi:hypothetical protein